MARVKDSKRKRIFRLFAQGKTPEQVVGLFGEPHSDSQHSGVDLRSAERLLEEYILLPMAEKLRVTHMPECVSNRAHRLMDDIADLKLVDRALLGAADVKTLASLLEVKRKIKERMAKECNAGETDPEPVDKETVNEANGLLENITHRTSAKSEVH